MPEQRHGTDLVIFLAGQIRSCSYFPFGTFRFSEHKVSFSLAGLVYKLQCWSVSDAGQMMMIMTKTTTTQTNTKKITKTSSQYYFFLYSFPILYSLIKPTKTNKFQRGGASTGGSVGSPCLVHPNISMAEKSSLELLKSVSGVSL